MREDFGNSLREMQSGRSPRLNVRPMQSIGKGVFELKDSDEKCLVSADLSGASEGCDLCPALLRKGHSQDRTQRSEDSKKPFIGGPTTYSRGAKE